jgi:NTP pyrophosphatase (non-canonical NTP hydrolase)
MGTVNEFITERFKARATIAQYQLSEANPQAKLLADEATHIALLGHVQAGDKTLTVYNGHILKEMGLTEEAMKANPEIAHYFPAVLPLDDLCLAVWRWQEDNVDAKASVKGLVAHLEEELNELKEALPEGESLETVKDKQLVSAELADLFIIWLHLCARLAVDPTQAVAMKLAELRKRTYGDADEQGRVKHERDD